jgi:hypothetical protein
MTAGAGALLLHMAAPYPLLRRIPEANSAENRFAKGNLPPKFVAPPPFFFH